MRRLKEWFKNAAQFTRIFNIILCACIAIGVTVTGVGCKDKDSGSESSSSAEECVHIWEDATCTQPKTCSLCGETEGELEAHVGVKTEAQEATCTENGNVAYWTCTACEKIFTDETCTKEITLAETVVTAAGHNGVKTDANAATCTEDGNVAYWTCDCGKIFADEAYTKEITLAETVVTATGHNGVKTDAKGATCTEDGNVAYWTCSCDKVFADEACEKETTLAETVIPATGHSGVKTEAKDATCTEAGNVAYWTCTCKKTFADEACTQELTNVAIPATGHSLTYTAANAATCGVEGNVEYWTCGACNTIFADEACTQVITDVVIPATGHDLTWFEAKDATCTEDGNIEYYTCTCGKVFADQSCEQEITDVVIAATGHTLTHNVANAATCTEAGNVEYWACSSCDKFFADEACTQETTDVVIPATGHSLTYTAAKAATCTEAGNVEYWYCSSCDKAYTDRTSAQEITDVVIPATGHSLTYTAAKAATCTEAGNVEYWYCSSCNKTFADEACATVITETVVPATGHSGVHTPANAATCTEAGNSEYWTCSVCDKVLLDEAGTTVIELVDTVIAATGHDWVEATCKAPETCSVCGDTRGELANHTEGTPATCTEAAICLTCGEHYGEAKGHTESIPATCTQKAFCENCGNYYGETLPHTYNQEKQEDKFKVNESVATCLQGATYYVSCECGDTGEDTFVGTPLAHEYIYTSNDNGTHTRKCPNGCEDYTETCTGGEATCTEKAVCSVCNDAYGEEPTHTWNAGVVTTEPGCTTDGVKTFTCTACSTAERTEGIPATGHNHTSVTTAPTCGKNGYTTYTCACGDSYVEQGAAATGNHSWNKDNVCESDRACTVCGTTEAKKGHDYQDVEDSYVDATCLEAAKKTQKCANCGDEKIVELGSALGHRQGELLREELVDGTTCDCLQIYQCIGCDVEVQGAIVERHSYKATITKAVTCQEDGQKALTCEKCGDVKEGADEVISHLDENDEVIAQYHAWDDGVSDNGVITFTCTTCGENKTAIDASTETSATVNKDALANGELQLKDAAISMDSDTLAGLGDNVEISAGKLDETELENAKDKLSDEEKAQLGDNPIYDFKLNGEGANFDGYVTVTIPYTLQEGEDVDSIAVWYMEEITDEEGNVTYQLKSFEATYSNGYITFQTNHFSYYTVTRLTPAQRCEVYGHQWRSKKVAPTCTADGYTLNTCIRCAQSKKDSIVPANGHDYTAVETPSTCSVAGKIVYTCACKHSYTVTLNVLPHNFEEIDREDATCVAEGLVKYACSGCDASYTEVIAKVSHELVDTVVAPTCTEHGYTLHECVNCEYSYQDNLVVALGHNYSYEWTWTADYSAATLTFTCANDNCGNVEVEDAEITVKEIAGSCTKPSKTEYTATVSFGGDTYTDKKTVEGTSVSHDYGDGYWKYNKHKHWHICKNCHGQQNVGEHVFDDGVVSKPATCTKSGEMLYSCICGYTKTEKIPATGVHEYADVWFTDANNHWQECMYCGEKNEKAAHTFGEWTVKTAATCTVNGLEERTCTVCDKAEVKTIQAIGHAWKDATCSEPKTCENCASTVGSALGHKWLQATCTTAKTCNVCGEVDGDALGHDYNAVVTKPTCTEGGYTTYTCTRCNDMYVADEKDALGHIYKAVVTEPTCTEGGYTIYTCVCGDAYVADEVDALGHIYEAVVTDPTCTEGGYTTYTCVCGDSYVADETDALGHDYVVEVVEPTCTEGGYTSYVCACGDNYKENETEALGHDYVVEVIEPTCTKGGYTSYVCACGDNYKEDEVDALGHNWVEANCQAPKTCSVCKATEGQKLDHEYADGVCTMCGKGEGDCDHQTLKTATIDLSTYGACGGTLVYETCECGFVKIWDMYEFDWECDIDTTSEEEGKDENGNYYMKAEGVCPDCGLKVSAVMTQTTDGCYEVMSATYVFVMGETTIVDDLYFEHRSANHTSQQAQIDLAELGACAGSLTVEQCTACGKILNFRGSDIGCEFDEDSYVSVEEETETTYYYKEQYTCSKCGCVFVEESWETLNGCEVEELVRMAIYDAKNALVFEYTEEDSWSNHNYEKTYEMLGESCEDGIRITEYCTKCGERYSYVHTGHYISGESAHIEFSNYGACGGFAEIQTCSICKEAVDVYWWTNCRIGYAEERYVDDNGIEHRVLTGSCKCGFYVQQDKYSVQDGCMRYEYCTLTIRIGEKEIVSNLFYKTGTYDEHTYKYQFTMNGDTCEAGYDVYVVCTTCGAEYHEYSKWHQEYLLEVYNLQEYGACADGYAHIYACPCGQECRVEWKFECPDVNEDSYKEEKDGKYYMVDVLSCKSCNITLKSEYYEGKNGCEYGRFVNYIFMVGDTKIAERSTFECHYVEHNYGEYRFEMQGNSCEDGYHAYATCKDCGELVSEYYDYHKAFITTYNFADYGACGGEMFIGDCPCGKKPYFDGNFACENMQEDYSEVVDDETGIVYMVGTVSCSKCGLYLYIKTNQVQEGCCTYQNIVLNVSVGANVILDDYHFSMLVNENHIYETEYVLNGTNCLNGVTVRRYCTLCDYVHEYITNEHIFTETFYDLKEYGACSGYVYTYECLCGLGNYIREGKNDYSYDDGSEGDKWTEVTKESYDITYDSSTGNSYTDVGGNTIGGSTIGGGTIGGGTIGGITSNGCTFETHWGTSYENDILHDIQTSVCTKCGLTIVRDSYSEQVGCYRISYRSYTYSIGDTVIISNFKTVQSQYENHTNFRYEFKMRGDSCEDGVEVIAICECGYMKSDYFTDHEALSIATYDLTKYGACNGSIEKYECPCGFVQTLELDDFCDCAHSEYDEGIDENGNEYMTALITCDTCQLYIYGHAYGVKEGCMTYYYAKFTVKVGETVIFDDYGNIMDWDTDHNYEITYKMNGKSCEDGYYEMRTCKDCGKQEETYRDYHHSDVIEEYDLAEFGLCGGYVRLQNCACGQRPNVFWHLDCPYEEENTEEKDENGMYRSVLIQRCAECGFEIVRETYSETVGCVIYKVMNYTFKKDGVEVIPAYNLRQISSENHNYKVSYELMGESCNDGVIAIYKCEICGESFTKEYYEHNTQEQHIDLWQYDTCGGYVYYYACACGEFTEVHVNSNCEFMWDSWNYVDENGQVHYVEKGYCERCGFAEIRDEYQVKEGCTVTTYRLWTVQVGEMVLLSDVRMMYSRYEEHAYEYGYHLLGETCENGVELNYTCKVCGMSGSHTTYGHEQFVRETIDLTEQGACGAYIQLYGCACGQKTRVEFTSNGCAMNYYHEDYLTEDMQHHSVEVQKCETCGLEVRRDNYYADGVCYKTRLVDFTVKIGEFDWSYTYENGYTTYHDYGYSFEMDGESCNDGYNVYRTCRVCGESYLEGHYVGHQKFETEKFDYGAYGACGAYMQTYACPCGEYVSYEFNPLGCSFKEWGESYYDDNGVYHNIYVRQCYGCGLMVRREIYDTTEGCYIGSLYEYTVTLNKDRWTYTFMSDKRDNHKYVHTFDMKGDSCEGGYTVYSVCKVCGYDNGSSYYSYHAYFDLETYDLSEYGACGGYVTKRGCPCGVEKNLNIDWPSCNMIEDSAYEKGEDGISHEITTWTCQNCSLVVVRDKIGMQDGCTLVYDYSYTVTVGETILLSNYRYYYWQTENHELQYSYEFLTEDQNCESGVRVITSCKNCDNYRIEDENYRHVSHYTLNRVNLNDYEDACGGNFILRGCPCGYNTRVDYYLDYCKLSERHVESYQDTTGVWHYIYEITCSDCGIRIIRDEYGITENCIYTHNYEYTLMIGEETIVSGWRTINSRGTSHSYVYSFEMHGETVEDGYTVYESCQNCGQNFGSYERYDHNRYRVAYYKLAEYGLCGGWIELQECPCGKEDYLSWNSHCSTDYTYEHYTDDNGIQHTLYTYSCYNCAMQLIRDEYTVKEGCYQCRYYTDTFSIDGVTIVDGYKYVYNRWESHNQTYEFEMNGESCADGYYVYYRCADCDYDGGSSYYEGHSNFRTATYDLADYGFCDGGWVEISKCPCGYSESVYWANACYRTINTEYYKDDNGVQHTVQTHTCSECAMQVVSDSYRVKEGCYENNYLTYTFSYDGAVIFEHSYRSAHDMAHNYVYSFEMNGDSCEDGYYVSVGCADCDYTGKTEYYSYHNRFRTAYYNLADYGYCGGYVETSACPCGYSTNVYWSNSCARSSSYEYYTDDNGIYHEVRTYTCSNCAMQVVRDSYTVKEGCWNNSYYEYTFGYDGETYFTCKYLYSRSEAHDFAYDFDLQGHTSCTEGVMIYRSCKSCDYQDRYENMYHETFLTQVYDLTAEGACEGSYINAYACPCGERQTLNFNTGCSSWDQIFHTQFVGEDGWKHEVYTNVCRQCGLMQTVDNYTVKDGCKEYYYVIYTVEIGETTILSNYKTYQGEGTAHKYVYTFDMEGESCDNGYYVNKTCAYCGDSNRYYDWGHSRFLTEGYKFEDYGACGGGYLNYYVCPCEYSTSIDYYVGYCSYTYNSENVVDESGVSHWIYTYTCNTCGLVLTRDNYTVKEGCRYNTYDEYSATIGDTVIVEGMKYVYSWSNAHDYEYTFEMNGESCTDGVKVICTCKDCGDGYDYLMEGHSTFPKTRYDLYEYGTCNASDYIVFNECPCGEWQSVTTNLHGNHTSNQYYDEEGRWVCVETIACSTCGLRYTNTWYTERDSAICKKVNYHTVLLNVGDAMVDSFNYQFKDDAHDYVVTAEFANGATNCEQGVTLTYTCKDCGDNYSDYYNHHYEYTIRTIDLAQYGSVCGGYAKEFGCACGYYRNINVDEGRMCKFDYIGQTMWVEGYIYGWQYVGVNSEDYFGYNAYNLVCAVTDPEQCAFTIRYADYYLPVAGECKAQQYVTWQFGYNAETGTCAYEYTYATNNTRVYHANVVTNVKETYEDGSYVEGKRYDCSVCEFYRTELDYYNAEGRHTKHEVMAENPLDNGYDKLYNHIVEYGYTDRHYGYESRNYTRYVDCNDNERWWQYVYTYDYTYEAPYGEDEYMHKVVYTSSYGTDDYTEEYGCTYVNGSQYHTYTYRISYQGTDREYWYRYDYVYDFDYVAPYGENGHKHTETYQHSNGASWKREYAYTSLYNYWDRYDVYTYYEEGSFWERYEYTYSIEKGCERTTVHTNSYGVSETTTESWHRNVNRTAVVNPTCTQDGLIADLCSICKYYWDEEVALPYAHSWTSLGENHYYCSRCELESENGASGDIVLEDLTWKYGNNENYVLGYYNRDNVEFLYYVALVLHEPMEDGNDVIELVDFYNFYEMEDVRAIYFSISEVEAMASEMGYTADQYDVRFIFVPLGGDGSFDYAITFTATLTNVTHITGSVGFVHYVGSGETVEYTVTAEVDSVFVFTTESYKDTYGYLYDSNGNLIISNDDYYDRNFRIQYTLKAGETYTLKVRWYSADNYGPMRIVVTATPVAA